MNRIEEQQQTFNVGNCKPPREHQFKPGQSGNPKGRPKGRSLRSIFRKIAEQSVDEGHIQFGHYDPSVTKIDAVLLSLFRDGRRGDNTSIKQVLDLYREFVRDEDGEGTNELAEHGADTGERTETGEVGAKLEDAGNSSA
jgi:hypothetical protein